MIEFETRCWNTFIHQLYETHQAGAAERDLLKQVDGMVFEWFGTIVSIDYPDDPESYVGTYLKMPLVWIERQGACPFIVDHLGPRFRPANFETDALKPNDLIRFRTSIATGRVVPGITWTDYSKFSSIQIVCTTAELIDAIRFPPE